MSTEPLTTPTPLTSPSLSLTPPSSSPATTSFISTSPAPTPSGRIGSQPGSFIDVISILLGVVAIWLGIRKLELDRPLKLGLGILDMLVLIYAVMHLGWVGLVFIGVANLLMLIITSVRLAIRHDYFLTKIAVASGESKETITELAERVSKLPGPNALDPIVRAELIALIADRARSPVEIEQMMQPIAQLKVAHEIDSTRLVEKFDRLLRLAGKTTGDATDVADTLTVSWQHSAANFEEVLDGLLAFYSP